MILTPYGRLVGSPPFEINGSYQNNKFLCPPDPQYFTRGTYGLYHDTPLGGLAGRGIVNLLGRGLVNRSRQTKNLGAIPTDAEIGKHYYSWYTPVQSNWIYAQEGYIPPPWVPQPLRGSSALGETTAEEVAQALMRELSEHNRRQFSLSALSTTVVVASSLITIYRTLQLIRDEEKKRAEATKG